MLAPEFRLLVQCCQWNFADASKSSVDLTDGLDWKLVLALARRHRVQGLVWNALAQYANNMPVDIKDALASDARSIAANNLAIAGECRAILTEFDQAGISLLFVKGLTVGALAYRSPLMKMGWDIDLLIDARDLEEAARLLERRGYGVRIPSKRAQLHAWHRPSKESVWSRDDLFHVELHTRLSDNQRLIPTLGVHSPSQFVEVAPGVSLKTLAKEELFAYLSVHGASSAWFRLKWISDFGALIYGLCNEELERFYRVSQKMGAGRAAGQALLLADAMFNSLACSPALRKQIESDPANEWLARAAFQLMTGEVREPTERHLGTLTIHWTQFFLRSGLGFKFSELARQILSLIYR
ncbi:nucleotidyltransferase family protein [Sphingomonas sp. HDW15A]|uniref:nucleotidyltransferase domain-containing protein n=1 Tax=Sphingomonas sp. HDW15A TaxID=2714942 RepID=UPI001408720D|nr:nucleotidyltransferase family protein [Sphingomonas sp. HDW15A]QIK95826.1 nucleotidyltransferase family protein [Sphingomonas sp. HDW15A]